jgi:hypothetical protein
MLRTVMLPTTMTTTTTTTTNRIKERRTMKTSSYMEPPSPQ